MLRFVAAFLAVPFLVVLLLGAAIDFGGGELGSLTLETFELGPLPIVIFAGLVQLVIYFPLLYLVSRFIKLSFLSAGLVGLCSVLLPVLVGLWPVLTDSKLRLNFRLERFADSYPWFAMGAVGGALFYLLALHRNNTLKHLFGRSS